MALIGKRSAGMGPSIPLTLFCTPLKTEMNSKKLTETEN